MSPTFALTIFGLTALALLVFGLVYRWLEHRAKHQAQRLRVLEDAVQRGDLDDVTRDELVEALTGRRRADGSGAANHGTPPDNSLMQLLGFLGWMCLCIGVTFFLLTVTGSFQDLAFSGAILCAVGFGLVSFPVVWRELQRSPRRNTREQES